MPEIPNLKSTNPLNLRFCDRRQWYAKRNVYVPVCVSLRRKAIAFILGNRLWFCWSLIFLWLGEALKCANHILVLMCLFSLNFLRVLCLETMTMVGEGENRSPELFAVPVLRAQTQGSRGPETQAQASFPSNPPIALRCCWH